MTVSVEQLSGEPLILMTIDGNADQPDVVEGYMQSIEQAFTIPGPVYRIVDIQAATHAYQYILTTIQELLKGIYGAAIYPQMAMVFVGTPDMAQTFACANVPFFTQFDDALAHARAQVAEGMMA
jgi:hypothetical protein